MSRGTIIFDFDGTLADSLDVVLELFYEITGHKRLSPTEIAMFRHLPAIKVVRKVGVPLHHVPRLLVRGRALMSERMRDVQVVAGIDKALGQLRDDGWQLMVMSSNSKQNVEAYLRDHNLRDYFERVYGNVGVFSKTQALRKVLRQNRLDRNKCYYVGDEIRDMQAARRAHVRVVAVSWGYNDPQVLKNENPFALAQAPVDLAKIFSQADI